MPRSPKKKSKAERDVPPWGRSQEDLDREFGLLDFSADVPLGNTDPTVVQGVIYGGMPEGSGASRGRLRTQRGKRT